MKILLSFVAALLLTACASVPSDYKFDPSKPNGLVIGTITYDSSIGEYGMAVTSQSTGLVTVLRVGSAMWPPLKPQYDDSLKARGDTFAREVPPGKYQITAWQVRKGYRTYVSTAPVNVAFDVDAGKATYIGNLHFDSDWENVELRDMSARDLPALQARFTVLKSASLAFGISSGARVKKVGGQYDSRLEALPIIVPIVR